MTVTEISTLSFSLKEGRLKDSQNEELVMSVRW